MWLARHTITLIRKLPGWLACEQNCTRQGQDLKRSGHPFAECGWIRGLDPKVPPGLSTGVKRRLEPWVHVWPAELMLVEVLGCAGGPSGTLPSARLTLHSLCKILDTHRGVLGGQGLYLQHKVALSKAILLQWSLFSWGYPWPRAGIKSLHTVRPIME